jgi:nitrate/nitrite transport system substrate-binding protein
MTNPPFDRRRFLRLGLGSAAAAVGGSALLSACGSDDGDATATEGTTATSASASTTKPAGPPRKLKLGFIALTDCAPLIMAKELGFYADRNLDVELIKQASWPATRDNLLTGQIDGAHCLNWMPYSVATGVSGSGTDLKVAMMLNNNGQAITLAKEFAAAGYGDLEAAKEILDAKPRTLAMTYPGGTHDLWLRYWLAAGGINPETDVSTIVIPPPQMVANMKAGTQDAFCVGEPWNGQLVNQKVGYTACLTSEIWMNHPEKSLGMRADWVAKYPRAAQAITMAVMEAQMWCDKMSNRPAMCSIVSGRQYINVPIGDILPRLQGTIDYGDGRAVKGSGHVMKFWADNASFPYKSHELWFLTEDVRWGVLPASTNKMALINKVNRADIWRASAKALGVAAPASDSRGVEKFFDGKVFDPANPAAYLASQPIKKLV